jgi:hypothetical protein
MIKSVDDSNSNILKRVLIHFLMISGGKKNIADNFVFFLVNGINICFKKFEMKFYSHSIEIMPHFLHERNTC